MYRFYPYVAISGDLLGGLAPPPPSEAILTLEAAQLTKLFTKSGEPVESVKRKMTKFCELTFMTTSSNIYDDHL